MLYYILTNRLQQWHWLVRVRVRPVAHSLFRQCCSLVMTVDVRDGTAVATVVVIIAVMLVNSQRQVRDGVVTVIVLGEMTLKLLTTL